MSAGRIGLIQERMVTAMYDRVMTVSTLFLLWTILFAGNSLAGKPEPAQVPVSPQTEACIGCHRMYTPGIVEDWLSSRHARTRPSDALKRESRKRRISAGSVSEALGMYAVGCYECHGLNPESHNDNFDHMGFSINVVVSPNDCSTCHPVEVGQYADSKKAHAIKNLLENPVYHALVDSIDGIANVEKGTIVTGKASEQTLHETCLGCHGTRVTVEGMKTVQTAMGEVSVPNLRNWPNQGVGRENPDGSLGACTACHPRHGFSIAIARKPYTCAQCHLEPDVPAWNVYKESKHGNIYASKKEEWNFDAVPWTVGKDFKAPTCATCHNSLLATPDGEIIAERTHDFGARLWVRLFGLIYAHPQPKSGNTTVIRNQDGLPLPTTFTGIAAGDFLIGPAEQEKRKAVMAGVCKGCHGTSWTEGHFARLDNTIRETNDMTKTATLLMVDAWERGIEDRNNPFDEAIEKMWIKQWLFYANSIRYASAMTGAPDYAAFKNGWWELSHNLQMMRDHIELKAVLGTEK